MQTFCRQERRQSDVAAVVLTDIIVHGLFAATGKAERHHVNSWHVKPLSMEGVPMCRSMADLLTRDGQTDWD